MIQRGYFRLATAVLLGIGITYGKIFFYHGISEQIRDKKISIRKYNDRTVYDCFDNPLIVNFVNPELNTPPMLIDDSYIPNKIY